MKCPRCSTECTGAEERGERVFFCPKCWKPVANGSVAVSERPADSDGLIRTKRSAHRTEAYSVPNGVVLSIELELPLPTRGCMSNGGDISRNIFTRNRAAQAYKDECLEVLPCLSVPLFQKARIDMTFYLAPDENRYHPRDSFNAASAMKSGIDALVQCGILKDDSHRYLEAGAIKLLSKQAEHGGRACVVIRLERTE